MIALEFSEIAAVLDAALAAGTPASLLERKLPDVSIDSRTLTAGQCFVAIRGPRFDGHEFVREALRKGCAAVVHSEPLEFAREFPDCVFLRVADTTAALQRLSRHVRRKWGGRVLAITGSMGKTTVRRFAAELLAERFRVLQSPGNLNNEYGVPLTLLQLEGRHQIAVIELGMNHPGEIRRLCRISEPDAAAITNVAPVHLEFFPGLDQIAAAKGEILETLPETGPLSFNRDDPRVEALAAGYRGRKISFGLEKDADVRISDVLIEAPDSMTCKLRIEHRSLRLRLPFAGRHFLYNVAAACAVARGEDIEAEQMSAAAGRLRASPMRGQVRRVKLTDQPGRLTLWDDSYNCNPAALRSVLDTLGRLTGFRRRVAALGEMLELGDSSPDLHRQAGQTAAQRGVDLLVTVGKGARHLREGAVEAGLAASSAVHFDDSQAAADFLAGELKHGDLLLVKGSRALKMERIAARFDQSASTVPHGRGDEGGETSEHSVKGVGTA